MRRDLVFLRGERRFLMCLRVWVTEKTIQGSIAQLDQEHLAVNQKVAGSIPARTERRGVYTERVRVCLTPFCSIPKSVRSL